MQNQTYPDLNHIKCLVFDLDNTLVNSDSAYEAALLQTGINPHSNEYQNARNQVKSQLPKNHTSAHNRLLYFKEMYKNTFSPQKILEKMHQYESNLYSNIQNQWKTLHRDTLFNKLTQKYSICILTNENTRTQLIKLSAMDPNGVYFKNLVCSEDVGIEKPSEIPFLKIIENSDYLPKDCLMIGDNIEHDLKPAQKLGFNTILTLEFSTNREENHTFKTIYKLDDILNLLL